MRPVMQKAPRYENRRLLDLCRGRPCVLGYPGCTGGTDPDAPSVPCHSNELAEGKGVGKKSDDHSAVPGCPHCHFEHDVGSNYTREEKHQRFHEGQRKWRDYKWRYGLVRVA